MTDRRAPARYREEAARFRELAAAADDSRELRDSYLALSIQFERLAQLLERGNALRADKTEPPKASKRAKVTSRKRTDVRQRGGSPVHMSLSATIRFLRRSAAQLHTIADEMSESDADSASPNGASLEAEAD